MRCLVIEENEGERRTALSELLSLEIQVEDAQNGDKALDVLRADNAFDAIFIGDWSRGMKRADFMSHIPSIYPVILNRPRPKIILMVDENLAVNAEPNVIGGFLLLVKVGKLPQLPRGVDSQVLKPVGGDEVAIRFWEMGVSLGRHSFVPPSETRK